MVSTLVSRAIQALGSCPLLSGIHTYSADIHDGQAHSQQVSCNTGFDGPKVDILNGTSYDFWYFEAVAYDGQSSVVVNFHAGAPLNSDLSGERSSSSNNMQLSGHFSNGTTFSEVITVDTAIVSTAGDGSNGLWGAEGDSWYSSPDMSDYRVELKAKEGSIRGSITMHSVAPAHYPCSLTRPGDSLEVMPGIGWVNAVPDADVTVDLRIHGMPFKFLGIGYHDKGVTPFSDVVGSWNWGHARMGPYSIVWLHSTDRGATTYSSGYVAYQGQVVFAQCDGAIEIRTSNEDTDRSIANNSAFPDVFSLRIDLGGSHGVLEADLYPTQITLDTPTFTRWVGNVTGSAGESSWQGIVSGDFAIL
ncbi:hypothetical protein NM208_g3607 [Fusarium decemcellulare]|uniref:Uncharacterized protein n=1 Tax=Fusarium decemcellulare TaxID=57161 RepID=A0ACC1SNF7_9HYPO|nr:hypothetical protein NM208_g3607 [Fusarium decemcellulare]